MNGPPRMRGVIGTALPQVFDPRRVLAVRAIQQRFGQLQAHLRLEAVTSPQPVYCGWFDLNKLSADASP